MQESASWRQPGSAWGPGAGGLAAVSSPHLPKGTGGKCSALIHKCGQGLRGFPGSPRVPGVSAGSWGLCGFSGSRPGLASHRRWRHLPALLQGQGGWAVEAPHGRVGLCTGSHKGAAGGGHQGGAGGGSLRDPTQALRRAARSPQSPSHSEISLVTSEPGGAMQEAGSGHLFSNYWYKNIQGCDL